MNRNFLSPIVVPNLKRMSPVLIEYVVHSTINSVFNKMAYSTLLKKYPYENITEENHVVMENVHTFSSDGIDDMGMCVVGENALYDYHSDWLDSCENHTVAKKRGEINGLHRIEESF